jgi:hypothetical protein
LKWNQSNNKYELLRLVNEIKWILLNNYRSSNYIKLKTALYENQMIKIIKQVDK